MNTHHQVGKSSANCPHFLPTGFSWQTLANFIPM